MKTISLDEYVSGSSLKAAADLLNLTPGGVRFVLTEGRKVFLTFDDRGQYIDCYEIARFPRRRKTAA